MADFGSGQDEGRDLVLALVYHMVERLTAKEDGGRGCR